MIAYIYKNGHITAHVYTKTPTVTNKNVPKMRKSYKKFKAFFRDEIPIMLKVKLKCIADRFVHFLKVRLF